MLVSEVEFLLRSARALLPVQPEPAYHFLSRALSVTVDARLRFLMAPALSALARKDAAAARKWLDRACEYEETRRFAAERKPRADAAWERWD